MAERGIFASEASAKNFTLATVPGGFISSVIKIKKNSDLESARRDDHQIGILTHTLKV